ncbi:MAG: hypothetical protein KJN64_12065 [Ignavibacteria bacterium]|nr:hypothetical protein [Ignavibacteria bacterium]MBT8383547.1 hypothetical protein [Ignavibacteria bacterium]MBT8390486.1 hypothetical protein [Ignavibacteria bacterium]NNJ52556.1 hypothetical protein [Ignavibacteriaceae bacterium]NNL20049.1 hypothetical protein [Ignavibacteriaceae bacterium]
MNESNTKAWVVSADMGYGHQRAVSPLKDIAEEDIITVGSSEAVSKSEKKLWKRLLNAYELFSRAKGIPIIGPPLFSMLDALMHIPSFYPMRNLSNTTFQVNLLESTIEKGLCKGMLEKISTKVLPLVTSFYASAIAADKNGLTKIYCIICDADINRVWVAKQPWESRIEYFAPCGKAAQRLKAYGVPEERIHLTGFPLPKEILGDEGLSLLKKDLAQRLFYLDPKGKFWARHGRNVEHFLGKENCRFHNNRKLTITFAVGGAGAQTEIGAKITNSLKEKLLTGEVNLNLVAGIREEVRDYFLSVKEKIDPDCEGINIIYSDSMQDYFKLFNSSLRNTDILWTKPSELSFYSALGIPIIMSPAIGSQEKFNRKWLHEIQAGIRQENPDYTDQWLYDLLGRGTLAESAWDGFLKARKLGTFKIIEMIKNGKIVKEAHPVLR